jgi:hypothetical protein
LFAAKEALRANLLAVVRKAERGEPASKNEFASARRAIHEYF